MCHGLPIGSVSNLREIRESSRVVLILLEAILAPDSTQLPTASERFVGAITDDPD